MFTRDEQQAIVLEYFGAEENEGSPLCPRCGESLQVKSSVASAFGLQVDVTCSNCRHSFSWAQPQPERLWKELHLHYFLEAHHRGNAPHCPYDDCRVSSAEFEGGVLQFNCPFCNRRGRIRQETG